MKESKFPFIALLLIILCSINSVTAQNVHKILSKSYQKCQSIQKGYYEMDWRMKYMSGDDTSSSFYSCYFKKIQDDSIFPSAFRYKRFMKGELTGEVLYSGQEFLTTRTSDSTGTLMTKTLWANDIMQYRHNYTFYDPVFNKSSYPLPHDSVLNNPKNTFTFIGEEVVGTYPCVHIRQTTYPENSPEDMIVVLKTEFDFWINRKDNVPVKYAVRMDLFMNGDTMIQYEVMQLKKYQFDFRQDDSLYSYRSIPSYYRIKDYEPYKMPEPIKQDTLAPDWAITSLKGDTVRLSELKGKLVLIDFFYKSCYPCMQALPGLQSLHEKYGQKGLEVIGIDPYDKKEDNIGAFLAKRGVTYTILLGGKQTVKDYSVSAYPTLFLVDRTGKVVYVQIGYGEGTEKKLEEEIEKHF